ncbi:polysaccharide deacetylase family protein [Bradyrhizobium sp. CCBAU 51753]|uniref:polysaccharide deacetylase family protein n=1 Tax=Bradyrhizobium sp. CCBAU 51753 TaxID=1325100 RepID=UPI00188D312D|nr:polysaccharide deacetylase family protein [Bradyrhizobium sp. CCBAU 51753]QOZ25584.1 polysaccharide deacetylase family protein [Bradyrhizobium sp. CCBAU 51753]
MRITAGLIFAGTVSLLASSAAWSQTPPAKGAAPAPAAAAPAAAAKGGTAAPAAAPAAAAPAPAAAAPAAAAAPIPPKQPPQPARAACNNPNALGVGRTVEIDTTGGPGFGFEHFKQLDFLRDKEVVLTFDDGPWPNNTPAVLKALADECTTGIFFPIGKHATYHPEILRQVYAAGHTVGAHTWSHANLNNKKLTEEQKKDEIERGYAAVKWALEVSPSPFFRFPALQHPPEMVTYLGNRNIAIFSCDLDSFDFKASKPQQVIDTVMKKLNKLGKGIVLMHDFQKHTAEALPELLKQLKAGGYKVVAMRAKFPVTVMPQYEQELAKDVKLPTVTSRPVNSVVTTVDQ